MRRTLLEVSAVSFAVSFVTLAFAVLDAAAVPTRCLNVGASLCGMLWSLAAVVDAIWAGLAAGLLVFVVLHRQRITARIKGAVSA